MNNEPVAWMLVDASWNDFCRYSSYPSEGAIPLYTHPADESFDRTASHMAGEYVSYPAKTLTDDPLVNFKPIWQEKPELTLTDEEIAEIIQHLENAKYVGASKAATMLRQQQAEIEALKAELRLIDELVTGKAQEK
jgi:hypothetical protein